jgi:hypothetical protein
MEPRYGVVYQIPPEPPDPQGTRWFPAGAVTFGLEYREIDPEGLAAAYAHDPDQLAELEALSPEGGYEACGVSIHVKGSEDDHEYLRFDVFDDDPHYHYVRPGGGHNHWVPFDPIAGGDLLPHAITCLRERLAAMLTEAGGEKIAAQLDPATQAPKIDELERLAYEVRERQRAKQQKP